jgi:uroporphyrinogen-III synthase
MSTRRPRVLVTRAEPGASETAARLLARNYDPVVEPAFTLRHLHPDLPPFDTLAFTSANGVRAFAKLSTLRDVPVFCVGRRTLAAAQSLGFANAVSADGDVTALGELIRERLPPGARLLHSGNEDARGDLAGQLRRAGIDARFVATYLAEPSPRPGPALAAHLAGREKLDAALVHSPAAGAILAGFVTASPGAPVLPLAGISDSALAAAHGVLSESAATPDEDALLTALDRLLGRDSPRG